MNGTSSRVVFAEGERLNPDWSLISSLCAVIRRAGRNAVRTCRLWQVREGRVRLPRVSSNWLVEFEATSGKHWYGS